MRKGFSLSLKHIYIQDWIFLGLVKADIVNASMNRLQLSTMLLASVVAVSYTHLNFQEGGFGEHKQGAGYEYLQKFPT